MTLAVGSRYNNFLRICSIDPHRERDPSRALHNVASDLSLSGLVRSYHYSFRCNMKSNWKVRRSIVLLTLLFCAAVITKIVWGNADSETSQVALYGSFGLAASVIGSYVFGAVWDDNNMKEDK